MGSLSNGELPNGESNERHSEDGHCTPLVMLKYKKRKVSAIRDFPPGCGPNSPRIIKEKLVDGDMIVDGSKASESGDMQLPCEEVKSPPELEMTGSLDDLVGKVVAAAGTINEDDESSPIKPLGDDFWETLKIDAPEFSNDFDKVEAQSVLESENAMESKMEIDMSVVADEVAPPTDKRSLVTQSSPMIDPNIVKIDDVVEKEPEVKVSPVAEEVAPPNEEKLTVSQQMPIIDDDIVKESSMKRTYPRRRVSATREFPPFCGRNAPCPTAEERARITFGGKSLDEPVKALQQRGESMVIAIAKEEELKANVKDKNFVPELKTKIGNSAEQGGTSMEIVVKAELDCGPLTRGSGVEEQYWDVREIDSPKRKLEDRVPGRKTKSTKVNRKSIEDDSSVRRKDSEEIVVHTDKSLGNTPPSPVALGWRDENNLNKEEEKLKPIIMAKANQDDASGGKSSRKRPSSSRRIRRNDKGLDVDARGQDEDSLAGPNDIEVTLPPFGPSSSSEGNVRNKVRETLRLFQAVCRKLLQGEEASLRKQSKVVRRIDLQAANVIRMKGKEINTSSNIIGAVPGVEVGDEFQYRVELALVGIHRLYQAGIDYMNHGGMIICTSIVASGGYPDELDYPDVLIYSGQGGNAVGKVKQPADQKLERGNLALKNSISTKNPVRVIRGTREKASNPDARGKMVASYAYDGLYTVEKYWHDVRQNGKLVFKFELRRVPGQPELAWKEVKKSKKFKFREGVCIDDISKGKELFPICAVNTVDDEKPPTFNYITEMIYPSWYSPTPGEGCGCVGGCSDSKKCLCVLKNGEEIPYNHNGAIVEAKPLVYECGPSCKCPSSCYNRVTQHGIKIQLEIFKTETRGWGVRSLTSIPSGSFICEYTGELLEDKEAEQRSNDEYLFDIGQNYSDCSHLEGLKPEVAQTNLAEVLEDSGFTIDAATYGNVGRFINHSCSPNLYAQNVLYDHNDKRMPHIMFFAAENIPALQELTYHYNYSVDQVRDSNGNVKRKNCYCGSEECTGRMY